MANERIKKGKIIELLRKSAKLQVELTALLKKCEEDKTSDTEIPAGQLGIGIVVGDNCQCID